MEIKSYEDIIGILLKYPKRFDGSGLFDKLLSLADFFENGETIDLKKLNLIVKEFIVRFAVNGRNINDYIRLDGEEELKDIVLKYPPKRQF